MNNILYDTDTRTLTSMCTCTCENLYYDLYEYKFTCLNTLLPILTYFPYLKYILHTVILLRYLRILRILLQCSILSYMLHIFNTLFQNFYYILCFEYIISVFLIREYLNFF
jgi:hypothetical protein